MPELVEAQILVDGLKGLIGQTLRSIDDEVTVPNNILNNRDDIMKNAIDAKLVDVVRRSKRPIWIMEKDGVKFALEFFLSMTGTFRIDSPTNVSRVGFNFNSTELYFQDSRMWARIKYHEDVDLVLAHGSEGLDPLNADAVTIYSRLYAHGIDKKLTMKDLLMDARVLAGIGNFYAQEILYDAKIKPQRPIETVDHNRMMDVANAIEVHLKKAYKDGGLSLKNWHNIDGDKGSAQDSGHVYGKKYCGCGTQIEKIEISGRPTYFCGRCQK